MVVEMVPDEVNPDYLAMTMKKKWRWVLLGFSCTLVISNYFCFDNPASLET